VLGVTLALLAALTAGGLLWKQQRDRDSRCDRAYVELEAASRTTAFDTGTPYTGVEAERRIRQCLEEGWTLGK
jgi:hypothetical protein